MSNIRKTFGDKSFTIGKGGAGTSTPHVVLQVLYGQEIDGLNLVKYVSEIPTEIPAISGTFATSFSPDGVGSAYLWTDGVRNDTPVLIFNSNKIYPNLLISGQVVTTFATKQIKVTGSSPETFQTFYIPYGY